MPEREGYKNKYGDIGELFW